MGRWVLVLAMICSVIDVIVCPPVSDKAPSSTPPPEGDDEVVSTQCNVLYLPIS